jgi:hypothetical protein
MTSFQKDGCDYQQEPAVSIAARVKAGSITTTGFVLQYWGATNGALGAADGTWIATGKRKGNEGATPAKP